MKGKLTFKFTIEQEIIIAEFVKLVGKVTP